MRRVYGAADPNSGTAALLEVAKGLGRLYNEHHWRPKRSIYLLSWSGEEYGLLGSTGWAELHPTIMKRAAAYLNTDTVVSGDHLKVSASPSLISLWKQVLGDLNKTAIESSGMHTIQQSSSSVFRNPPFGEIRDANTNWEVPHDSDDWKVGVLGSGSDYTVFLDHFGIPSMDFSFDKRLGNYGQYHSIYDSYAWMNYFGGRDNDVGSAFELMEFAAKIWGLLTMRMASSAVVPLDPIVQGLALTKYTSHIEEQVTAKDVVQLQNLTRAVDIYKKCASMLQLRCTSKKFEYEGMSDQCNEKLVLSERKFLLKRGLPKRPWFKHVLQAPGLDLGYAAEAFPGIQQPLNEQNYVLAQDQVEMTAERIRAAARHMEIEGTPLMTGRLGM